jgi:hypothetical protein
MAKFKTLKYVHVAGTAWFVLCMGYIFVLALRQAGVNWWIVLSLSGHGTLIALILISLYLFAIFRGISSSQRVHLEHPLTCTSYYQVFYVVTPLLGGLAGCLGMIGVHTLTQFTMGIALGTLGMTFLVWVIVDPLIGLLEMLLPPASRRHRAERLAKAKSEREREQRDRERLLEEVLAKAESERKYWRKVLKPQADELAELLITDQVDFNRFECEVVSTGVKAWQVGGLSCMRELRDMAIEIAKQKSGNDSVVDCISGWWNGIGNWREPSFG